MKTIMKSLAGSNRLKLVLFLCLYMCTTHLSAKNTTFDLVGTSRGIDWVDAEDDKTATKAYIVFDNGNENLSILSETFKNSSRIKPTPCKYIKTDKDGYRIFENDWGQMIYLKGNELRIENELMHLFDPTTPYIFYYNIRTK